MPGPVIESLVALTSGGESPTLLPGQSNSVRIDLSGFGQDTQADVLLEALDGRDWTPSQFSDRTVERSGDRQMIRIVTTPSATPGPIAVRVIVIGSALVPDPKVFTLP